MAQAGTQDRTVTRALALVLLREVQPLLDTIDEPIAGAHLQAAIDALLHKSGEPVRPN